MKGFRRRVALATALALVGPVVAIAAAKSIISMSGSTSVYPLAVALATEYHKLHSSVGFRIAQGGSDIGIDDVAHGRVTIGDASRDPEPGVDPHGLTFTKIARDGVCVITNRANPISNLSAESVAKIFTGTYRDWSQVPGARISGPIDLFDRDGASGTQDAFQHIFLEESERVSPSASAETSNGLEQQAVTGDAHAIGFVSFAYTPGVNAVGYQGVPCTLRNAKAGQYGGVRNFWMVTKGAPKGEAKKFLAWVTKSGNTTVRSIVNSSWIAIH